MLLPYEVTTQLGADFDFDKIYFIVKDFVMSKDGKFKIFKYIDGTSEQNVLDRYKALINHVLKNDKNARDLVKQANKEIEEFDYTKIDFAKLKQIDPKSQLFTSFSEMKSDFENQAIFEQVQIYDWLILLHCIIYKHNL